MNKLYDLLEETSIPTITAKMIAPVLRLTGFRFSKDYRWGTTAYHRVVYAIVSTPMANLMADRTWDLPVRIEPTIDW